MCTITLALAAVATRSSTVRTIHYVKATRLYKKLVGELPQLLFNFSIQKRGSKSEVGQLCILLCRQQSSTWMVLRIQFFKSRRSPSEGLSAQSETSIKEEEPQEERLGTYQDFHLSNRPNKPTAHRLAYTVGCLVPCFKLGSTSEFVHITRKCKY